MDLLKFGFLWLKIWIKFFMKELYKRSITGLIFGILVIGSIISDWKIMALVFGVFLVFAVYEFSNIVKKISSDFSNTLLFGFTFLSYFLFMMYRMQIVKPISFILFFALIPIAVLFEIIRKSKDPLVNVSYTILGVFYLAVPFGLLILLRTETAGLKSWIWPMFVIGVIWSYDTFAYFSGLLFGKNKLCERISPKKTWEGLIGGLIMSSLIFVAFVLFGLQIPLLYGLGAVITIIISATLGDLFESILKRKVDIKDSGNILPGHGGVLDRFDSVFFAVPVFIVYWLIFLV